MQELLGRSLALIKNSGLKATLLKTFTEVLADQIIDALAVQYVFYVISQQTPKVNTDEGWKEVVETLPTDKLDENSDFISMSVVFYDPAYSNAKHEIDLEHLDLGNPESEEDKATAEIIKLILFLFNQHLVSDAIYKKSKNPNLQLPTALTYANMYIDVCQSDGSISVYNILMHQPWILGLHSELVKEEKEANNNG
jgi:hypothetical protein